MVSMGQRVFLIGILVWVCGCGGGSSATATGGTVVANPTPLVEPNVAVVVEEAARTADGGDVAGAIGLLEELHANFPGDLNSHLLLGALLDYSGKPDAAVAAYESGCTGTSQDVELYMAIAALRKEQAEKGPQYSHSGGGSVG